MVDAPRVAHLEMGLSHGDFFRVIPAVFPDQALETRRDGVRLRTGVKLLKIELAPEAERRIGQLRVPLTTLEFTFDGYSAEEIDAFLTRFHRHFHKGGG